MIPLAATLLRSLLGSQVATGAASAATAASAGGGLNFANLLTAARSGQLTSNRPVEASPEAQGQLSSDQLSRIAVAADHAESAGMSSALVMIDGKAVKLDVTAREVTAVVDPRVVAVTDIDGVLAAPPSSLSAQFAAGSATGATGEPTSIAGAIEQQLLAKLGNRANVGLLQPSALSSSFR